MEEEKKIPEAPVEEAVADDEDEFLDARPAPVEPEPAPEEVPAPEPEPVPEPEPESKEETPEEIVYDDPRLQAVEDARVKWTKSYKKSNTIKMIFSFAALALIILGYALPYFLIPEEASRSTWTLVICAVCAVIGLGGVATYGFLSRKQNRKDITDYFNAYYGNINAYAFDGLPIETLQGNSDCKIDKFEVEDCGMYPCSQIGSRDNLTFTYEGMDCALCDMAAQKDNGKALATVFVGKYLRSHNFHKISPDGIVIYFKGNDRALPPTVTIPVREDSQKMVIYGSKEDTRILTHDVKMLLKEVKTDKLLVDVAIAVKPGRTFIALGYEDDLMVLPNDKPFNPKYVRAYKEHIALFLKIAKALEGKPAEDNESAAS